MFKSIAGLYTENPEVSQIIIILAEDIGLRFYVVLTVLVSSSWFFCPFLGGKKKGKLKNWHHLDVPQQKSIGDLGSLLLEQNELGYHALCRLATKQWRKEIHSDGSYTGLECS